MGKVVVLAPIPAEAVAPQLPDGHEVVSVGRDEDPSDACREADVVVADWTAHHRVAGDVVRTLAPTCRLVQVPAAGLDSVDLEACREAGIPVASCAGLNAGAVAEWCVWATIGALRQLVRDDRTLRSGEWTQLGRARYELAGKTVGIVGMGDIGQALAPRIGAFDVDLRYWTRTRRSEEREAELGVTYHDLDGLIAGSDVVVLAIALTADTRHLIDADRLSTMKDTAVLVNAARGEIVDDDALADALAEGRIHGAAVDVWSPEPPPDDHPLFGTETAIVNPHLAGTTAESAGRILGRSLDNVKAVLSGEEPEGRVT